LVWPNALYALTNCLEDPLLDFLGTASPSNKTGPPSSEKGDPKNIEVTIESHEVTSLSRMRQYNQDHVDLFSGPKSCRSGSHASIVRRIQAPCRNTSLQTDA